MLTKEERIAAVSARLRGMMYEQTRADFARRFRKSGPTRLAIKNLVNKFQRTGSVADEERPGRPALPQHTVQNVQNAITHSPSASTRRLSRELGIPQTTVWRTLRYRLKKHAYHLQVVHKLAVEDYASREAACYDLLEAVDNNILTAHVSSSDEATFHTCGPATSHNCRIRAADQPNLIPK